MGDCSNATVTVLKEQAQKAKEVVIDSYEEEFIQKIKLPDDTTITLTVFSYYEVKHGELFIRDLTLAGIPYTHEWDAGDTYPGGQRSSRYTPEGESVVKTITENDWYFHYHQLLPLIDNPTAIKELILKKKEELEILPWLNQVEYGKRYLTKQLINVKEAT